MKEKEINEPNSTDMNRKGIVTAFLLAAGLLAGREAQAQRTYEEMEQLTVNERVTMVVTVSEARASGGHFHGQGEPAEGTEGIQQLCGLDVHRRNDALRPTYRELAREDPQRGRREESDFSQRQDTDYRDDGTTELQPQHQPEHRLRRRAVGRFVQR